MVTQSLVARMAGLTASAGFASLAFILAPLAGARLADTSRAELVRPSLEVLEAPRDTYRTNEVIHYKIRVRWPRPQGEVHFGAPNVELVNLELLGVSQETTSGAGNAQESEPLEQVLNFRFRGLQAGPARINRILLKWTRTDGVATSQVAVPALELKIKKIDTSWLPWAAGGGLLLVGLALIVSRSIRKQSHRAPPKPFRPFQNIQLEQLRSLESEWTQDRNDRKFLSALVQTGDRFLAQELDWHLGRDSYNVLEMKAKARWSAKDASLLVQMLKRLEFQRFSGTPFERKEIEQTYRSLYTFIDQKRIISSD